MKHLILIIALAVCGMRPSGAATLSWEALKATPSPNAVHIGFHTPNPKEAFTSEILCSTTKAPRSVVSATKEFHNNQYHMLKGLKPNTTYYYKIRLRSNTGDTMSSPVKTFTTGAVSQQVISSGGGPLSLTSKNTVHTLTKDVVFDGDAIRIEGDGITLDLNGHTITYAAKGKGRFHGVTVKANNVTIKNGRIIQSTQYTREKAHPKSGSYGLASFGQRKKLLMQGCHIHVHAHGSYPVAVIGDGQDISLSHNLLESDVTTLHSRHYPGNDLIRLDLNGGVGRINNNILLRGAHRGITVFGKKGSAVVENNDVAHESGYVNGYAINAPRPQMKILRNRITSIARGIHITGEHIEVAYNYLDTKDHMYYDDRPQGSTTYRHYYVENHGIKLENCGVGVKVHHNTAISRQPQPLKRHPRFSSTIIGTIQEMGKGMKNDWDHMGPATPLNFHVGPNAMAEIHNNTFIAITEYPVARYQWNYAGSGEWAAPLRIVHAKGTSDAGKYSIRIYDNVFKTNDAFAATGEITQNLIIENNRFELLPNPAQKAVPFRSSNAGIESLKNILKKGKNTFVGHDVKL